MSTWREAVADAARATACAVVAANDSLNQWWASQGLPFIDQSGVRAASAARAALCNDPTPTTQTPGLIPGGQCPNAPYELDYRVTAITIAAPECVREIVNTTDVLTANLIGPLTNPRIELSGSAPCGPATYDFLIDTGVGTRSLRSRTSNEGRGETTFEILDVRRTDGLPDDCGSFGEGNEPPYVPVTINRDVTFINNEGNNETVNYDFTLLAPILIGGNVFAPVTIAGNTIDATANIDLNGEVNIQIGVGTGNDDTVDFPVPDPDPTIPEPDVEPTVRRIVAVVVTCTIDRDQFRGSIITPSPGAPALFVPRLASVHFLVTAGGRNVWTLDYDVKVLQQRIDVEQPGGAVDVSVTTQPGVGVTITRIFSNIPESVAV